MNTLNADNFVVSSFRRFVVSSFRRFVVSSATAAPLIPVAHSPVLSATGIHFDQFERQLAE